MAGGGGGGVEGDVELNIAPIIDCFTVLIAYMLVSMAYIQLSIFDVGIAATPPADAAPVEPPPPDKIPLNFSVEVAEGGVLNLKLTGGSPEVNKNEQIPPINNEPNTQLLTQKIQEMKQAHPDLAEANLAADNSIKYRMVIKLVQSIKQVIPKVFLASQ